MTPILIGCLIGTVASTGITVTAIDWARRASNAMARAYRCRNDMIDVLKHQIRAYNQARAHLREWRLAAADLTDEVAQLHRALFAKDSELIATRAELAAIEAKYRGRDRRRDGRGCYAKTVSAG